RCSLRPLRLRETAAYIAGRIGVAGGDAAKLFTAESVQLIHKYSGGVPRTISVICENALVTGFAADQRPIDVGIVQEVCRDLDLIMSDGGSSRTPETTAPGEEPADSVEQEPAVAGAFRRPRSSRCHG